MFCDRCAALTDMGQAFLVFCGNPNFLDRNVQTVAGCNTANDIKTLGIERNAPQLIGLANRLDSYQRRAGGENLVPIMIKQLQSRVAGLRQNATSAG
jgi:hypothetical protein